LGGSGGEQQPGGGGDGGGMGSLDDNFDAEKKAMQVARNSGAIRAQFRRNSAQFF
jgi:hypothetical protein